MKTRFLIVLLTVVTAILSCSKNDDDMIDCEAEAALVAFDAAVEVSDPKLVSFKVEYSGNRSIKNIEWVFGDGSSDTTTLLNTSHVYTTAGNYTALVKVQLEHRGDNCTVEQTEAITVN